MRVVKKGQRDDPHHTGRNYKLQALGLVVVSLPVGILQYHILLWNMREKHLIPSITCPPISLCQFISLSLSLSLPLPTLLVALETSGTAPLIHV